MSEPEGGWYSTPTGDDSAQVHPIKDLAEHVLSDSCWCKPSTRRTWHGIILVHNSLDGREKKEPESSPRSDS